MHICLFPLSLDLKIERKKVARAFKIKKSELFVSKFARAFLKNVSAAPAS